MPRLTFLRMVPALLVLTLVSAACSRMPPGAEVAFEEGAGGGFGGETGFDDVAPDGGGEEVDFGGSTFDDEGSIDVTEESGGEPGSELGASGGESPTTSSAGTSSGGAAAAEGREGSGRPAEAAAGSGPGIEGRTIKIAFHNHWENCPNQGNEPSDQARTKGRRVINDYVKFYNEHVLAEHNWQFEHTMVDDGGYHCPERQRAAGLEIAQEIEPFAALGDSSSSQGPIVADMVTRAGTIHIGTNWAFQEDEKARHPYAWNLVATAEQSLKMLVGWMEKRIKGTQVSNRMLPGAPPEDRVYGILGIDDRQGRRLAKLTRDEMVAAGMNVQGVYFTAPGAGVAAQQAPTTVAKMRQDGVNSLVWGLEMGAGRDFYVAFTNVMEQQNYLPDILLGTGGNAFFEQLNSRRVWANAKGVSAFPPVALRVALDVSSDSGIQDEYDEINENSQAYMAAWEYMGHSDSPQEEAAPGGFGVFANLGLLATGIIHAGDVLNAETFARGLESAGTPGAPNRCTVARFVGRDYPHVFSYVWNSEHAGGAEGWTSVYWVNRQSSFGTNGYYESYDNYVYFQSKDDIPNEPIRDTGEQGTDIKKQERIGLRPWLSCSEFPNFRG